MSKGGRNLSDEERYLWRRAAKDVRPRRPTNEPPDPESQRKAKPQQPRAPAPPLQHKVRVTPPQDRGAEKRVRRGKLEIGATLDLHGHNQTTGRTALERFLRSAQARGERTVIVVTGVGRGGHGVLRAKLPEWLAEPAFRAIVNGFARAHRSHGGEGAYYVFLRRAGLGQTS